jgi:putative ABC transport system permease protein
MGSAAEGLRAIRTSIRSLRRSPGLTAVSVLALALGIGLTTAMYSIVHGALRDLPLPEADRLLHLERNNPSEGIDSMEVTLHDFAEWREGQRSFEDLAAFSTGTANLSTDDDRPERYDAGFMTGSSFALLRSRPVLGRTLQEGDDRPGAERVAVLGWEVWQDRFRGERDVIGRSVRINGEATTVVGVMEEGFRFPIDQDLWLPKTLDLTQVERGEGDTLEVFGRLRDGVTVDAAQTEMTGLARRLAQAYPETNEGVGAVVQPYTREFIGTEAIALLYTMLGVVFGVLLIACANVANLLLARSVMRGREVAVRTALGAGRLRVVLGVLAEATLLSLVGSALGLGLGALGTEAFGRAVAGTEPPYWLDFRVDFQVFLFVAGLAVVAALASGLLPAFQAAGARAGELLKDETRGSSSFRLGRLSRALVIAEVAVSCGLLVATGLMVKSVVAARGAAFPFATEEVFTARLGIFETEYPTPEERVQFFEELRERLAAQPGVASVGLTTSLPTQGSGMDSFALDGESYASDDDLPRARVNVATPGLFETLRLGPVAGRLFEEQDRRDARQVALVNLPFAELFFPGESPGDLVGRRIRLGELAPDLEEGEEPEPWRTIVGVVPDTYLGGTQNEEPHGIFLPLAQSDARFVSIAAVAAGAGTDPMTLAGPVRDAVSAMDPYTPIYWVRTMDEMIHQSLWFVNVFGAIFAVFGLVGLVLAMVGLYGVMAFSVERRTHEVGIRMALGAAGRDIVQLVLRQGAVQLGIGLVLGVGLALALSRGIQTILFQVDPWDAGVFVTIVLVLLLTGAAATLIPARRASVVDPAIALRD